MVSENLDVIAEGVHQFAFDFTAEQCVVERSLYSIAGINEHYIFMFAAHTVNQNLASGNPAQVVAVRIDG